MIIIDAKNKALGRTAAETAATLRGKKDVHYLPNVTPKMRVKVINLSGAQLIPKKIKQKTYKRHTGYPGNLKSIPLSKLWDKNPKMTFKKIVSGMLPKNKLRNEILKNLVIEL